MSYELHDDRIADLFARAKDLSAEDQVRFLVEECRDDPPEVQQRLETLLAADRQLHDTVDMETPKPAADTPVSRTIGPFKLLQLIGEGGMGEVWLAEQQHPLRRQVALKLIKSDSPTKEIIARFEAERQALAMMDHPNIARVLDAGQTDSGQPYFVMDLVEGTPITDYCDNNRLTPRERLELFLPVCQAIQHAHQKGIIHRDVKPSNVLVTLYDAMPVAKVIDFGLAKALQTQTRLTDKTLFTGFGVVGTLRYMSPEQAEMNALDVDTQTDVYSLGVILYELLTGSTPLGHETIKQQALVDVLQIIREQEPPRPSKRLSDSGQAIREISALRRIEPAQLSRILRGDLDWVVMKALEKDRKRRYATAASLADDVQRHLENEPVQARPPSFQYRFGKLARKHRAAMSAVAAVLAILVIGIIVTSGVATWAFSEQARANVARKEAESAQEKTMDALRSGTDDVVEKLIGSRKTIGPNERAYLTSALNRWQTIADEQGDSVMAWRMRAEGALNVASLQEMLGERQAALTNYHRAINIGGRLVEQHPAVPEYKQHLAGSHNNLGNLLRDLGDQDAARAAWGDGMAIRKNLVDLYPNVSEYQHDLAASHINLGNVLRNLGDKDAARAAYEHGLAIQKKLVEQFPDVPEFQQHLATSHNNLGILLRNLGDKDAARATYEAGLAIQKKLVDQCPAVPEYQQHLAARHINLGTLLRDFGDQHGARAAYEAGLAIQKKLVEQFPAVPEYQRELAGGHNNLGTLLRHLGDKRAARAAYEAGLLVQKKLVEQFPDVPKYQRELAMSHNNLGGLLRDLGDHHAARAAYEASLEIRKPLVEQFPDAPEYQQDLATTHSNLGNLLTHLGDKDAACTAYEAGLAIRKRLVEQFPAVPEYQRESVRNHNDLAYLLRDLGDKDAARAAFEAGVGLQRNLIEQFPAVPEYQLDLAGINNNLGTLLSDLGDQDAARAALEESLAIQKKLAEQFPAAPVYQVHLGRSYCNLGIFVSRTGKPVECLDLFGMAVQILKAVHDREPRDVIAKTFLRSSYHGRAFTYELLQRHAEAVKDWDQTIELSAPREQLGVRVLRAVSQVRAGAVTEAIAEAADLTQHPNWAAEQWYYFACIYSIASTKLPDKQQENADRAMELLRKAVQAGYKDVEHLKTNDDLAPLRERDDFKKLVTELDAAVSTPP